MSDRARDVWVEHLVNVYMGMPQQEWAHTCVLPLRILEWMPWLLADRGGGGV